MSLIFAWRSNTTTAYYAPGGEQSGFFDQGVGGTLARIASTAPAGCIGTSMLDLNNSGVNSWRSFNGIGNGPVAKDWTINYRFSRGAAGTLTASDSLFNFGGNSASYFTLFSAQFQTTTDKLVLSMRNQLGQSGGIGISIASQTINTIACQDFTLVGQQSLTGSILRVQCFLNGSSFGSEYSFARGYNYDQCSNPWESFFLGRYTNNNVSVHYANELVIFDTALSAASVASAFPGESRSSFYSTTANQPGNSTDPGIANVNSGTTYTFKGQSLTGTLALPNYTDPGVSNVRTGTDYIFNDSTLTGTLSVPTATTGTSSTVPLNTIKEQIRYVLAENNTTTGAPVQDLSENLSRKVKQILKVNPEKILPSDNELPCVTVFIDSKDTAPDTIARNGATGKRRAEVNLKVVGLVYEPFTTDKTEDPADEDLEILMENVEKVLRNYDTLGNNVTWKYPSAVTYHSLGYDEQNHYRGAIMDLRATVFY